MGFVKAVACLTVAGVGLTVVHDTATAQSAGSGRNKGFNAVFKSASKEEAKLGDADPAAVPGIVVGPGTQLYGGVAIVDGIDVNKDQIVGNHDGSAFSTLDLGLGLVNKSSAATTTALVRGSVNYFDINRRSTRVDLGALIDTTVKISPGWTASAGAFFLHDDIDTSQSDRTAGHAGLTYDVDQMEAFLRLRSLHREFLNGPILGPNQNTIFDSEKSFSNTRTEAAAGALWLKDQPIAPYAQVAVADVNFNRFLTIDPIFRNSQEFWGMAGFRLTLSPQLYVDAGARHTVREFTNAPISNFTDTAFDGKIVWTPAPNSYFEFAYEDSFEDPLISGAYFSRRSGFALYGEVRPTERTYVNGSVNILRQDQIGTNISFDEFDADIKAGYRFATSSEVFVVGAYNHAENSVTHDTATSGRLGVGFKYGY